MSSKNITATCEYCGVTFPVRWPHNPNKYCSKLCSNRAKDHWGDKNPNYVPRVDLTCETCRSTFSVPPSQAINSVNGSAKRSCSAECDRIARTKLTGATRYNFKGGPQPRACEICGTVKMVPQALLKRFRACSKACAAEIGRRLWPRISSIERAMSDAFAQAGLNPEPQYPVGRCSLDFAFPEYRLAVECDGNYWHGRPDQRDRDRRKDWWLRNQGWYVLRLTETDINTDASVCVQRVQAKLAELAERTI